MELIFGRDIAVDLGTATVLMFAKGRGIVLNEPSVVAMDKNTGRLLKVGIEAQHMLGRTPGNIVALRPLRGGVISDYEMTERMLREFIRKVSPFSLIKPRLLISVPGGITELEERAVIDAGLQAGARKVYIIEEPLAAALGAELPIDEASGRMVVDIGGGTTDIAVISMSGIVKSASIKTAGDSFNEAIIKFVRKNYSILVGERTAEELKIKIGCVFPQKESVSLEAKGRCLLTGLPKVFSISTEDMLEAFDDVCMRILEAIYGVLESTPPELVADISENGITLTGGGSLIKGMDKLIEARTHISTRVAKDAGLCVAYGTGRALEWLGDMQDGTINLLRRKQML